MTKFGVDKVNISPIEYISGDAFERFCGNSLTWNDITALDFNILPTKKDQNTDWYFIKVDYLGLFKEKYLPSKPYYLITGKSDYCIDRNLFEYIDNENLIRWYSTNINHSHTKLRSIPLGVNNEWWYRKYGKDFANHSLLSEVISLDIRKKSMVYANFNINNNRAERTECLNFTGANMAGNGLDSKGFRDYLIELKQSFFCLAPNGNGIDTHRLWESLYVGTIPIVTRSINSVQYEGKLPIVFVDSWAQFKAEDYTEKRYAQMMSGFDFTKFRVEDFLC